MANYTLSLLVVSAGLIASASAASTRVKRFSPSIVCNVDLLECLGQLSRAIAFRYMIDMVDVYDRLTGRNDEMRRTELEAAELAAADAEARLLGLDGEFALREAVVRAEGELAGRRHEAAVAKIAAARKAIREGRKKNKWKVVARRREKDDDDAFK